MAGSFGDLHVLSTGLGSLATSRNGNQRFAPPSMDGQSLTDATEKPRLRFGRMFPDLELFRPPEEALIRLGQAMVRSKEVDDNPQLTAGYTYLGQFIDHEITFDQTTTPPGGVVTVDKIVQARTPSLDLDSLYGQLPINGNSPDPARYESDRVRLKLGSTKTDSVLKISVEFQNDLPGRTDKVSTATISDERNDENLAVAQTTVAFIKFHNAVVKTLEKDFSGEELFKKARQKVIEHYQCIVLNDFLPALINTEILEVVINQGNKHFLTTPEEEPFMPVEFSRAAFRIGHSQVRDDYDWNRFFRSPSQGGFFRPTLSFLLDLTGFRGNQILGNRRLPTPWIIDWTGFFNFAGFPDVPKSPVLNLTKKIDTSIAEKFSDLPIPPSWPTTNRSLAVVDLLRGSEVGLPAAQTIVKRLKETISKPELIRELTAAELTAKHAEVKQFGFDTTTPLWYYILREAEVLEQGLRLGPVGSYILAETFAGLIRASTISILRPDPVNGKKWQPDLGKVKDRFFMTDMLYFVNDLNPLATL